MLGKLSTTEGDSPSSGLLILMSTLCYYSPDRPEIQYIDQNSLKLIEICLTLPPEC